MKTIEERVEKIKYEGECGAHAMKDHKLPWLPDDGSFDKIIADMHNAKTKDELSKAYHAYITNAIEHHYSDGYIIGGIIQNEEQNKKFNVNIDSVVKSFINIKYPTVMLEEPVKEEKVEEKPNTETAKETEVVVEPTASVNAKSIEKAKKKVNYMSSLLAKLENNNSKDPAADLSSIEKVRDEFQKLIESIDMKSCSKDEIGEINDTILIAETTAEKARKIVGSIAIAAENNVQQEAPVQQGEAAHTQSGFNINNFVKQPVGPKMPVANNTAQQQNNTPSVFPHQICGLTDAQIVEEVGKHFKVIQQLPAYALYDLCNNKYLAKKMKELDAKQRPNNPYLTQVNINEYIDVPELLQKYTLCFTMPCNNKKQMIVVLFNPTPVSDKNGLQYPIHIFKAAKTKNNNK